MKDRILIVAAHPDDEVLGCGGVIAKLSGEKQEVFTLILGKGVAARYEQKESKKKLKEIKDLKKQAVEANKILGVKDIFIFDFPDNRFDTVPLLDIVKVVEKIKKDIMPIVIFTHYENDLNIDHQITHKAVITATRPLPEEAVKEIYSFEVPSSTGWSYPVGFSPNAFFDIADTLRYKLMALKAYKAELSVFPHPRSLEGIELNAKHWGMQVGLRYAEAFKVIRFIR